MSRLIRSRMLFSNFIAAKRMVLHLVNDEKIIGRTIQLFEAAAPGQNLFVVFANRGGEVLQSGAYPMACDAADFSVRRRGLVFSAIVVHGMCRAKIRFLKYSIEESIPAYWIIWGADLYNTLLAPKGFELFSPENGKRIKHANAIVRTLSQWKKRWQAERIVRFVCQRINYLVTDITDNDYDQFVDYYPQIGQIPHKKFFYYPIDEILGPELLQATVSGQDILVGNSNSLTNNHAYAFRYLSALDLGSRRIVVPLSYNGTSDYRKSVLREGVLQFGEQFCPLTDFLPLATYNEWMQRASVAIYGAWRQEAIGNIIIALYLGARVFIAARNPVYTWAVSKGLIVYKLETITQQQLDTPLTPAEKEHNRNILLNSYNRERFLMLAQSIFFQQNNVSRYDPSYRS